MSTLPLKVLTPARVSVPLPDLVKPPDPPTAPPSVVKLPTVSVRVEEPRPTVPFKVRSPVPVASPRVTLPPSVILLARVRAVPLSEAKVPPFKTRLPVPRPLLLPTRSVDPVALVIGPLKLVLLPERTVTPLPFTLRPDVPVRAPETSRVEPLATVIAVLVPTVTPPDCVAVPEPKEVVMARVPPAPLPALMVNSRPFSTAAPKSKPAATALVVVPTATGVEALPNAPADPLGDAAVIEIAPSAIVVAPV